jgi:hypothetical protein
MISLIQVDYFSFNIVMDYLVIYISFDDVLGTMQGSCNYQPLLALPLRQLIVLHQEMRGRERHIEEEFGLELVRGCDPSGYRQRPLTPSSQPTVTPRDKSHHPISHCPI